jgi:hypothetical protein
MGRLMDILCAFVAVECMATLGSAFSVAPHVILGRRTSLLAPARADCADAAQTRTRRSRCPALAHELYRNIFLLRMPEKAIGCQVSLVFQGIFK